MNVIGKGINRIDGRAKVTGRANYAADNHAEGLVHACGVFSTIASGRITKLDTAEAERAPGVLAVLHHGNVPRLYRTPNDMEQKNRVSEIRPPFEDDRVYYAGQFVAAVVAETFEQARAATGLVKVSYEAAPQEVSLDEGLQASGPHALKEAAEADGKRGDAEAAFAGAPVKIDVTYTTPTEVHNPLELHASVAEWDGDKLKMHESTQWVVGQRNALALVLGIGVENVTISAPYIGGGFGGKLFLWPHTVIAAVAARKVNRPVKLVVPRQESFTTVGHRPETRQRLRLGATPDGKLVATLHESLSHTSKVHDFLESCGETTRSLYSCPNVKVTHQVVPLNVGTPVSMRAPGAASGTVALEGAMDELALALKLDPIELRIRNEATTNEDEGKPWSSRHLVECYRSVSDRFGWERRTPAAGSMRDGDEILGWGMASASWIAERIAASARVQLLADGSARVRCATQDIGTGTYTVIAQMAAEILGLPVEKIAVEIGSSDFPEGPISGGSMVTATIGPAIAEASRKAIESLIKIATGKGGAFAGKDPKTLTLKDGALVSSDGAGPRPTIVEVLGAARLASADGEAKTAPGEDMKQFGFRSFGAHCVEVRYDPGIAKLRVSRIVSAFDVGRVINAKTAANQIYGSLVMGVGMALFEEAVYDSRHGRVTNASLAEYLVPLISDVPAMDIAFLDHPDLKIGEFGARGIGEIGITGIAAAIVNAVYHATGKRIRNLPVTIEKLLA